MMACDGMKGHRFGRLTCVAYVDKRNSHHLWSCLCDCGRMKTLRATDLVSGHATSCGCSRVLGRDPKDRMSRQPEYEVWKRIRHKCQRPSHFAFKFYGAKGIRVCDGWSNSYASFLKDMGLRPLATLEIDRIDNARGYTCGHCDDCLRRGDTFNCRWTTRLVQQNNMSTNVRITLDGVTHTLAEWCRLRGLPYSMLIRLAPPTWEIWK